MDLALGSVGVPISHHEPRTIEHRSVVTPSCHRLKPLREQRQVSSVGCTAAVGRWGGSFGGACSVEVGCIETTTDASRQGEVGWGWGLGLRLTSIQPQQLVTRLNAPLHRQGHTHAHSAVSGHGGHVELDAREGCGRHLPLRQPRPVAGDGCGVRIQLGPAPAPGASPQRHDEGTVNGAACSASENFR
jgi:hypothetical protein